MADKEVGIVITARDDASKTIKAIAKSTRALGKAISNIGKTGATAFKAFTFSVTALNQAFQLGKGVFDVVITQLTASIERMRMFREVTDPAVIRLDKFIERIDSLGARIGDQLLPVLFTLERILAPVIIQFETLSKTDAGFAAERMAEAFTKLAIAMDTMTPALRVLNGAVRSLGIAFKVVEAAVLGVSSVITILFTSIIGGAVTIAGELAKALGREGLGKSLEETGRSIAQFSFDLASASADAVSDIGDIGAAWAESDRTIRRAGRGLKEFFKDVSRVSLEESKKATLGGLVRIGEVSEAELAALNTLRKGEDEFLQFQRQQRERLAGIRKKDAVQQQQEVQANADAFAQSFTGSFFAVATGAQSLQEVLSQTFFQFAQQVFGQAISQIVTSAVTGQAKAIEAHSFIPFVGAAIGAAAGAAIFAIISAGKGKIPKPKKMQQGGLVTGGSAGRDSVPALLTPGEFVLTQSETRMFRSLLGRIDSENTTGSFQEGGLVPSGGIAPTLNLSFNLQQLPDRIETRRWVRSNLIPALGDLGFIGGA